MGRIRMGNPYQRSEFICLKCFSDSMPIEGIQRGRSEKLHIKDCWCIECKEVVKTIEVRFCDYKPDIMDIAIQLHDTYYDDNGKLYDKWKYEDRKRIATGGCLISF